MEVSAEKPGRETGEEIGEESAAKQRADDRAFFGHPRGLSTLFFTEAWERFSYYGMKAILLFYMYDRTTQGGLGIPSATAKSLIAVYGAAIFLAAIGGGWVSDRLLGARRATLWGGALIMCGHIALALPAGASALYISMVFIVAGTGLLKPNVSTSVGRLYAHHDLRREAGFSLYYMCISIGAVVAPLTVGTLGQGYNYHLGFSLAAVGMAAGLLVYVRGRRHLSPDDVEPPNPLRRSQRSLMSLMRTPRVLWPAVAVAAVAAGLLAAAGTGRLTADVVVDLITALSVAVPIAYFAVMLRSPRTTPAERTRLRAYVPLFVAAVFFWLIQEQGASVLAQYADQSTDLDAFGFTITSSWFQSIASFVLIVLTPLFATMWMRLGPRQPSTPVKFGVGLLLGGLSYVLLVIPAMQPGKSNPLWLFASFTVITVGEMLLSPTGLSVTNKLAPAAFATQTMGLWLAASATAQGISAQVVQLYDRQHAAGYFGVIGGCGVAVAVALLAVVPFVKRRMRGVDPGDIPYEGEDQGADRGEGRAEYQGEERDQDEEGAQPCRSVK